MILLSTINILFSIALVIILFIIGLWVYSKLEEKDEGASCSCIVVILMVIITIGSAIGMMKSCTENDHGPSVDYYDAPRK